MNELTQAKLKQLLNYDHETGIFTWKKRKGKIAGALTNGYIRIKIHGKLYYGHRLAWLCVNGYWPVNQIDHINRVRNDNRIINLREATSQENQFNRGENKNNTSGYRGVSWYNQKDCWRALIGVNGKKILLGYFTDIKEASQVFERAKEMYHII